ncbi:MAG: dihydroneopterin aldolase [Bacteroidota bacterium]
MSAVPSSTSIRASGLATVRLTNAVFYAHHGVTPEEHRIGGRFEVDVAMDLDVTGAAQHDDLDQTVNYERVYERIRGVIAGEKVYLIERLAYLIAEAVLGDHPLVTRVEVLVRKPNPPVGGPCDAAEAVYRAERAG